MDLKEILVLGSAVVVVILLWIVVGVRHLKGLVRGIEEEWELLNQMLRTRQDIVPNLIETVRLFTQEKEALIEEVIEKRAKAMLEKEPSGKKVEKEYDLTEGINALFALSGVVDGLGKDTNFLELRREIDNLEKTIDDKSKHFNQMVRYYNEHRKFPLLRPLAAAFGFENQGIFEFEM